MRLKRETEYGLKALTFLAASPPGSIVPLSNIAQSLDLPQSFLAKIFQKFMQYGLVKSHRGKSRGYALSKPPSEFSVRVILESIEGPKLFDRCVFWNEHCGDYDPCPLHDHWKEVKKLLVESLEKETLKDLSLREA